MYEIIKEYIETIRADLLERPCKSLILAAAFSLECGPRDMFPDWMEALASGSLEKWESVIEVATADLKASENETR